MRVEDQIKQLIRGVVKELGLPDGEVALEHPAEENNGDYSSNIAMAICSKHQSSSTPPTPRLLRAGNNQTNANDQAQNSQQFEYKSPRELAEAIVERIVSIPGYTRLADGQAPRSRDQVGVEVAGPGFINFYLSQEYLVGELGRVDENYGKSQMLSGKKYVIEHTSPNPNKAMHLGHLRNNLVGMAIGNIWEAEGAEVVRDCVDNNRGIAIAKLMWGYLKFAKREGEVTDLGYWYEHRDEWQTPESVGLRPDRMMDELYVKGAEDFKANGEVEEMVRQMVVNWEAGEEKTWALWRKVLDYVYQGQGLTLERLGNKWDKIWHEHEHYKQGKELVEQGLERGVLRQLEDGAVITDLEGEFGLTDTVVRKADGTALYITQDLALTKMKKETYGADKLFWVIGPEQSLAMKQVFAVCAQLGIGKYEDFVHLAYGYMSIKGVGKMSSRAGNVVYIDELLDLAKAKILKVMASRGWEQEELAKVAEEVAMGAVKYSILKVGRLRNMEFDVEESVSFEGNSGPYVQYTYARTQSVLRKSQISNFKSQTISKSQIQNLKLNTEEVAVLRWLYRFPEVVEQAATEYAPHLVAGYVYELAGRYNGFYNKHSILGRAKNESPSTNNQLPNNNQSQNSNNQIDEDGDREFRLALTAGVGEVLKSGLGLLGIKAPKKM